MRNHPPDPGDPDRARIPSAATEDENRVEIIDAAAMEVLPPDLAPSRSLAPSAAPVERPAQPGGVLLTDRDRRRDPRVRMADVVIEVAGQVQPVVDLSLSGVRVGGGSAPVAVGDRLWFRLLLGDRNPTRIESLLEVIRTHPEGFVGVWACLTQADKSAIRSFVAAQLLRGRVRGQGAGRYRQIGQCAEEARRGWRPSSPNRR